MFTLVSVIIPAYNEAATVDQVIRRVWELEFPKEVVVVDDGSSDDTASVVQALQAELGEGLRLHRSPINLGKGASVRIGYSLARGDVLAIQDADLELDPADLARLVDRFAEPDVLAVYGSRFAAGDFECTRLQRTANGFLTFLTRALYGTRITDMETCYKLFRRRVIDGVRLEALRFEFEPEVTAKVLRSGVVIHEEPIRYRARNRTQGKKIGWRDGVQAVGALIRWRLAPRQDFERR